MAELASDSTLRELPSRFSLPLIGDTLAFVRDPAGFLQGRARELGPVFRIDVFGHPTACFVGPEAFAIVLDDRNVERAGANPPHVEEIFDPQAIPFLDGAVQRRRKRLLMQAFTPDALGEYLPTIERIVDRFAERWGALGRFAWVPELTTMGFAIAGALFVGADGPDGDRSIEIAFDRVAAGILSLPLKLPFTPFTRALAARRYLLSLIDEAIVRHEATSRADVLSRLLAARDGSERLAREEVRIETFHFFAAYAAVIGGLSLLAQCLGRDPEVRRKAREEILKEAPSGPLTLATLQKLEYLDRVCKESRRAAPVLPITFFGKMVRDCTFDGMRIPNGYKAVGCIGPTLQDPSIYSDPERFDPDRWLNATDRQRNAWIPHGGGIHAEGHRCAGEALATLMLKSFAVHMLRRFEWSTEDQDPAPTRGKLFATPASGLPVRLRPSPKS
ncbi:MAG TPA: cytochrome P450 [Myxococcales bacterium]|jgi:cytochrome P450|nr:cytochrome P450 [Myxococcales bacterium]